MRKFVLTLAFLLLAGVQIWSAISVTSPPSIGRYNVWEMTITHDESPYSNTWDIVPTMVLTSPTGASINVDGFYYDVNTWKVRFAPWETGTYQWALSLGSDSDNGTFVCNSSNEKGYIRIHPTNPYRFIYESDSSLFTAHGFGSCVGENPIDPKAYNNGSGKNYYYLNDIGDYSMDEYLDEMVDKTGFNLYRWTSPNCSWALWDTISVAKNVYSVLRGQWGDDLIQGFRARGVRFLLDPLGFGWQNPTAYSNQINFTDTDAIKKYYRYIVARYGAYLDIFELVNEYPVSDLFINEMVAYIKSIDPYNHIITTSWANPAHPLIEMNSRHEYPDMNLFTTDLDMISVIESGTNGKYNYAKPIMFDETGTGSVWAPIPFPDTSRRPSVRVRTWVSFFNEAHNVYWEFNSQPARGGGLYMDDNIRSDFGVYHNYTVNIPSDVVMDASSTVSGGANGSRVYGLKNATDLYLYVFAPSAGDIPPTTTNVSVDIIVPADGIAYWYNTVDGSVISSVSVTAGATTLNAPPFQLDIALKVLGGVQSDTQAPTVPTGLTASNITESTVELNWNASTDNIGVHSYIVYVNGIYKQTVLTNSTRVTGLDPETSYSITVAAMDKATNLSAQSGSAGVTTPVATLYSFTVNSGTGDGNYREGTVVTIEADAPQPGYVFDFWSGDSYSIFNSSLDSTTITIPRNDVVITANYRLISGGSYTLTVNSGTGDGAYAQGAVVNISADTPPTGQVFDIWTGDVAYISSVSSAATSVTMPASDVSITATYKTAPSPVAINVSNVSPAAYEITTGRDVGDSIYTDRDYVYNSFWTGYVPGEYVTIKTANNDDASTGVNHLSFDVDVDADVYIGIAGTATLSWMSGWTNAGATAVGSMTEGVNYTFYKKTFSAGTVTLGGNESAGPPTYMYSYMYVVFVKPATSVTTYSLTVNNGAGSGNYAASSVVNITANAPVAGKQFDVWTGDVANVADTTLASTTITMPAGVTTITATYKDLPSGGANVVNFDPSAVATATARTYDTYVGTVKTWQFDTAGSPFFTTGVDQTEWYGGMIMDDTQDWWPTLDATDFFAEVWSLGATRYVANFVWLKQNFLSGFDQVAVGFDAASSISINVLLFQGETTALRFVVKDNGQYYLSEAEFQGSGLHTITDFNNNSAAGKGWGVYNPDATNFGIPSTLPSFTAHDFTNITQIGFVLEATKSNYHHNFSFDSFTATGVGTGSTPTYALTVNNGTGSGDYQQAEVVVVSADPAPGGQVFNAWTGDVANIADVNSASTTIAMPAAATSITATYTAIPTYALTVNNGTGTGNYYEAEVVSISADPAPVGQEFSSWTGDVATIADTNNASTILTMPATAISVSATYRPVTCIAPSAVNICIVGVDNLLNKNAIQWNPAAVSNASIVNIYKETDIAGEYTLLDTANVADGIYVDNTSDPDVQANRYKLSAQNACGEESILSAEHKTIHLNINQGTGTNWNLMWDNYIGFTIDTYTIYRGTSSSNLIPLITIAGTLNSYTDKTAPTGSVYYQIEVVNPAACGSKKAGVSSKSNVVQVSSTTDTEAFDFDEISVYPNPASSYVTIAGLPYSARIQMINSTGQLLKDFYAGSNQIKMQVSELNSGIYLIKIQGANNETVTRKIIIK